MADIFVAKYKELESPLTSGEAADFSAADYTFEQLPRALNCSAEGTLVVDMGALVQESIHVVAGLNPYRVHKIYNSGSTAMTVVGMW
jgi:hypothetical protein